MINKGDFTISGTIPHSKEPSRQGALKFPQLPDAFPDAILIINAQKEIYYANPAWEKLTGYTFEEVKGKVATFLRSEKTSKRLIKKVWSELSQGKSYKSDEIYERRKDGTEYKIHSTFFPLKRDDEIIFYAQVQYDITEHSLAETILKEKDKVLNIIINNADAYAIFMLDKRGVIKTWSIGAQKQNGYMAEEVIGKHFSLFFLQKDIKRNKPQKILKKATEKGKYEEVGIRVKKDGATFWASVVISAIRGKRGALQGFIKVTRDITEEKNIQNKIRESERKYRTIMERASDAIVIHDMKRKIVDVNTRACELLGYTKKELLGSDGRDFIKYEQSSSTPEVVTTLKVGESALMEREILCKDGSIIPVEINSKRISRSLIQSIIRDISERKKVEKQKDAFIGIASHELKTPVTTLSAYTQILEERLLKDKKNAYFIQNIKIQTDRLKGLIDDLLNVSKIDSGKLEIRFKPFDLNILVNKIIVDFQFTTNSHEIIKEGHITGKVLGDEHRIEQVIVNLLTNAIKYSPNAKKVVVHLSSDGKSATVAVEDFGFGIEKKDQDYVFERFYRTQDKEEGKVTGFGLGLYIASQIIKHHKGRIWLTSEKGKGSIFSFSLPLD